MRFFKRKAIPDESAAKAVTPEPFVPPADYQLEPEFAEPVPRPCPPELRPRAIRELRGASSVMFVVGIVFSTAAALPPTQRMLDHTMGSAVFLMYGRVFGALGLGFWVESHCGGRYSKYLTWGQPVVVEIRKLVLRNTGGWGSELYELKAEICYQDPETGADAIAELSGGRYTYWQLPAARCTYRKGDFATAVFLRDKPSQKTKSKPPKPNPPMLYGFTGHRSDLGVVSRRERDRYNPSVLRWAMFGFLAFLGALTVGAYGAVYLPIDFSNDDAWLLGFLSLYSGMMLCLLVGSIVLLMRIREPRTEDPIDPNERPGDPFSIMVQHKERRAFSWENLGLSIYLMVLLLASGSAVGFGGSFLFNTLANTAPTVWEPIVIEKVETLPNRVFLRHKVTIHFSNTWLIPHVIKTGDAEAGWVAPGVKARAEVHTGLLGWRWVKAIAKTE